MRITSHIRDNLVAYVALFFAVAGGTALAVDGPLPGVNQVGSEDIINAEVQQPDIDQSAVNSSRIANQSIQGHDVAPGTIRGSKIEDNSVTGADIDEASLSPACPVGYQLAGKDVCFGEQESGGSLAMALATCAASGDRVPTIPEAWLVLDSLPNPPAGMIITWTSQEFEDPDGPGGASPDAISMDKDSAGVISRVDTDQGAVIPYRCVTSARG